MSSTCRVAPFGYLRIKTCLQFPEAFRSLPRPSSPPEAKASTVRSCNLLSVVLIESQELMCLHLFSFTRCLEIAVHNFTIKTLYLFKSQTFNFLLTLPRYLFSNLSMNFPFFLKRAAKIRTFFYPANFSALFFEKSHIFFKKHQNHHKLPSCICSTQTPAIQHIVSYARVPPRSRHARQYGDNQPFTEWGLFCFPLSTIFCYFCRPTNNTYIIYGRKKDPTAGKCP